MNRFLKAIWLILTLDCEQSARLSSDSLDRELSLSEKVAFWIHRKICKQSRQFDIELRFMNAAMQKRLQDATVQRYCLSQAARERIREALRNV
jgi:hypothetical protein